MVALSRKQREIAQRHQLFLDIAQNLIQEEGCAALSMDRLAEQGEYSRGTVYQHFTCKEEVLIQVCNNSLCYLLSLFEKAKNIPATNRDRMLAVLVAHNYFNYRQPHCNKIIQYTSDHSIMDKVNEESLQKHNELEANLLGVVGSIVADAINDKDLTLPDDMSSIELVFGLWSLSLGSQLLQVADLPVPLEELGISKPEETIARVTALTLDGLNWQPLYDAKQHQTLMDWLKDTVFVSSDDTSHLNEAPQAKGTQDD
jgi:AcrR family transcriptional regulator